MNKPVKGIFLVLFIIIVGLVVFLIAHLKGKQNMNDSQIKYMHFYYSTGTMINAWVRYDVDKTNDKYVASIKPNGISEDDILKVDVNKDFIDRIQSIMEKYNVNKWNSFNKSDPYVLDGNSFSLSLSYEDGTDIDASGYMKYPKNYSEVKSELDSLFMKLYEDNKR